MLTVGELIEQLKQYDPATLVLVPDTAASAQDWDSGHCWTEITAVNMKPTLVYRPRHKYTTYLFDADAWIEVPAVRLAHEYMEELS